MTSNREVNINEVLAEELKNSEEEKWITNEQQIELNLDNYLLKRTYKNFEE